MRKFEYCNCDVYTTAKISGIVYSENGFGLSNQESIISILDYYGDNGWELISVTDNQYLFKREKV